MGFTIKVIPFDDIENSFAAAKQPGQKQEDYNTVFHTQEEITAILPQLEHHPPDAVQPWILLSPWLDLIKASQGLTDLDTHLIELPNSVLSLLTRASTVALITGHLHPSDAEDLRETFPRATTRGEPLTRLLRDNPLFARLDTCSLKDAILGQGPVKDVPDLWTRLASSARASAGLRALRAQNPRGPAHLYLFPWNARMDTGLEYRVFCAPPAGRISAVSQYKWALALAPRRR